MGGDHRAREIVATWAGRVAVALGLLGAARLIAWANRWYVTTMFARDTADSDGAEWHGLYERMASAHEALLSGVVLLALAAALLAVRVRARPVVAR